ncbi:MAG: LLM class F420-dependent oxidoreductase [Acidimicrobiaceae bacterium]|jgi:probable F420-dependent oxidoreductase|nr:LLM class F420-dependent oxidoreductase [Acidimicrobiaceae bacterium]|tara:strand:+ start:35181 stop:36038 length:858 start_codon:yes stop_codon:yes gene_type:complete
MKIGVVYPQTELQGDPIAVKEIGLATEDLGYDHLLAYDHVVGAIHADRQPELWGPYTNEDTFHCPFTMFSYLAGITEKIELVTGVIILPQRQTALVAKQTTDVDLLSGERLRLGVGTGWNYVEYEALGQEFSDRGPRLSEQIGLLRKYWSEDLFSFEGEYDRIDRGNINIRPNRQIPIWLGGFSEIAFKRAGELGDGFIYAGDHDHCLEGKSRTEHHLREFGRSEAEFGHELIALRDKTPQATAETIKKWGDSGGTHASIVTMNCGLSGLQEHLDFIKEARDLID